MKKWFKTCLGDQNLVAQLKKIKLIVSDIDGALTDGRVLYHVGDDIIKGFSVQDGFGMMWGAKAGLQIALVSGRVDAAARSRAHALGISDLYFEGIDTDKSSVVKQIQEKLGVKKDETLMFGDDVLDLQTRPVVGMLATPQNALFYVEHAADIRIPRAGGDGALRLLIDLLLYVQERHFEQDSIVRALAD